MSSFNKALDGVDIGIDTGKIFICIVICIITGFSMDINENTLCIYRSATDMIQFISAQVKNRQDSYGL